MHISFHEWDDSVRARRTAAALRHGEIQIWIATVPPDERLAPFLRMLAGDERERAQRFRVAEPRRQFIFARILLRQLLSACLDIDPAALVFGAHQRGKPFVDPSVAGDLRFNLSHSRSLVVVGLARGREIGVDVEWIEDLADRTLIAARIFSERELERLRALPEPLQLEAFFHGWTRKEAYLKATGAGLSDALETIEVTLAPGDDAALLRVSDDADAISAYTVRAIPLPPGFVGAVAFANAD